MFLMQDIFFSAFHMRNGVLHAGSKATRSGTYHALLEGTAPMIPRRARLPGHATKCRYAGGGKDFFDTL